MAVWSLEIWHWEGEASGHLMRSPGQPSASPSLRFSMRADDNIAEGWLGETMVHRVCTVLARALYYLPVSEGLLRTLLHGSVRMRGCRTGGSPCSIHRVPCLIMQLGFPVPVSPTTSALSVCRVRR